MSLQYANDRLLVGQIKPIDELGQEVAVLPPKNEKSFFSKTIPKEFYISFDLEES